ncbi:MmpS family transport accessory protein [Nocardia sp. NPDC049149]|uniref:MmpS family transport accessory protein n=1 Tax=Nocardia sp. NPDC049149 TaxID=3364315 RepID=UPI003713B40D
MAPPPRSAVRDTLRKHGWIGLVIVVVLAAVTVVVLKLPDTALVDTADRRPPLPASAELPRSVIEYRLTSESTTATAQISYLGGSLGVHEVQAPLPWSIRLPPSSIAPAGITAEVDADSVTCTILVDGQVRDAQTATGERAAVSCNVIAT